MLEVKDLHVSYGGIRALRGVNLEVPDGRIVTLIGANGAGKSTMLRTISGLVKAESGSVLYNGKELAARVTGIAPEAGEAAFERELRQRMQQDIAEMILEQIP